MMNAAAFVFAILVGVAGASPAPAGSGGIAMAKRLTAAIKGEAEFHDSDFSRPLEPSDKAALRGFAPCKVENITYTLAADPTEPDTYVRNPNEVLVRFGCKGVSIKTPVGLSLHFRNGRIETVETHNADLIRKR